MNAVAGPLAQARTLDTSSFADITPTPVASVGFTPEGLLEVVFEADISAAEAAAVGRRITMQPAIEAAFAALEERVGALEARR